MPTEIIRPNSDLTNTWGTPCYSKINEAVTQPSAGNGTYAGRTHTNGSEQQCGFPTPTNSGTCTQVTIWMSVRCVQDALDFDLRIQVNGSWTSVQNIALSESDVPFQWVSATFSVSNALATLGLQVGLKANGLVHGDEIQLDTLYAVLTYTAASSNPNGGQARNTALLLQEMGLD